MVFLRLAILIFLALYSYLMGQLSSSELNSFGSLVASSFFLVAPTLYFLPTIEGWLNKSPDLQRIILVNLLLGWSLIGWVVALVWAIKKNEFEAEQSSSYRPVGDSGAASERLKKCPDCAESVLNEARVCKHCKHEFFAIPR